MHKKVNIDKNKRVEVLDISYFLIQDFLIILFIFLLCYIKSTNSIEDNSITKEIYPIEDISNLERELLDDYYSSLDKNQTSQKLIEILQQTIIFFSIGVALTLFIKFLFRYILFF